jgi:hypothetical protein
VERFELSTMTRRTATAFKILTLTPLLALLGCDAGGSARPRAEKTQATTTAMPKDGATAKLGTGSAPAASARPGVGKYGAPLGSAREEKLASVLGEPGRYAGQSVRVEGHVRRACSAMGCWMELAESAAPDSPACRVMMKGHAFFVPTDAAGSSARVEGTLEVKRIEPGQVRHMEEEGGKFPRKAPDGSAEEVRFVASGVELWRS